MADDLLHEPILLSILKQSLPHDWPRVIASPDQRHRQRMLSSRDTRQQMTLGSSNYFLEERWTSKHLKRLA